jgi:hypothetical protein
MFKCEKTGRLSQPNESSSRLVTHVRNVVYRVRNTKIGGSDEIVGHGTEIVREITVCNGYYAEAMANGFVPTVVDHEV